MSVSASQNKQSFLDSYIQGEVTFGFWGLIAKGLAGINALIIISELNVYQYGLYVLIFAFYYLVVGFVLRPLSEVINNDIFRFSAEGQKERAKKLYLENVTIRFLSAFAAFLAVYFGANIIAYYYEEDMALLFRLISFVFLIDVWTTSMRTLFQIHLRFSALVLRQVLYRFLKFVFILLFLVLFSFGIREALLAHVLASFFAALSFAPAFIKLWQPWRRVVAVRESVLWHIVKTYGKWDLASQLLMSTIVNVRPWLIKFFINTEAVAIYSVAESIFGAIKTLIPTSTLSVLIPREVADRAWRGRLLLRGTKYFVVTGLILGITSALIVPSIIQWFIPHYTPSIPLFLLLLIVLPLLGFRVLGAQFVISLRKQKFIFFTSILKIILGAIFPVTLLYFFGIWGMPLERILVAIVIGAVYYGYLIRYEIDARDWKTLITFGAEDRKFLRSAWGIFTAYIRGIMIKYRSR